MRASLSTLPILLLLLVCGVVESFVPTTPRAETTKLCFKHDSQQHEDHLIPDEKRAERSKQIRDKLLGENDDASTSSTTTATKLKSKSTNKKTKKQASGGGDSHAILHRLTQLFDQHMLDMEDFDFHA